jgi:hypothetical protein
VYETQKQRRDIGFADAAPRLPNYEGRVVKMEALSVLAVIVTLIDALLKIAKLFRDWMNKDNSKDQK